jgi:hypothetical protein
VSKIVELAKTIDPVMKKGAEDSIYSDLSKVIAQAYTQIMSSDEGFCFKFTIPMTIVMKFFDKLGLDEKVVNQAFAQEWGHPDNARMFNDPYYQILSLLIYWGLVNKKENLTKNALVLILMKLWNGRKHKYLKFCDKRVMKYVVTHMTNNKHGVSKYETPLTLIKDYYTPTLLEKYAPEILSSPVKLKRLFEQAHTRIRQIFVFNMRKNVETGKSEATGGLLPMYMKARQEGMQMTSQIVKGDGDDEPGFEEYSTTSNRDEIASTVTDNITMNTVPQYPQALISMINSSTKVSAKVIEKILVSIHNHKYYDMIHDLIGLILSRTNVNDKNEICKSDYILNLKKNVISSKNNEEANKIQSVLNLILEDIFKNVLGFTFNNYSNVQKIQIRNVVIYGIHHNLRKSICKGI